MNTGNWHRLLAESDLGGMARTVASHCLPEAVEGATLQLLLQPEHEILYQPQCDERIAAALATRFGHAVTVRVRRRGSRARRRRRAPRASPPSASSRRSPRSGQRQRALLMENFSGKLHRDSITVAEPADTGREGA